MRDGSWGGYSGYDRFFANPPNNAQLAAIGTYDELVPGFLAIVQESDLNGTKPLVAFFERVKGLAKQGRATRRATLANMAPEGPVASVANRAPDSGFNPGKPLFDPSSICDVRAL
jgi:predicted aminopeptidase